MAIAFKEPLHTLPVGIKVLRGEELPSPVPFRIYVVKTSPEVEVQVSAYSHVMDSPTLNDKVQIVGLDVPFEMPYGKKIWLEIFYDRNLQPVFGIIKVDNKWRATVSSTSTSGEAVPVYPNELEFIVKKDLTAKIAELDLTIKEIDTIKTKLEASVTQKLNIGILTQEEATAYQNAIGTQFEDVKTRANDYKTEMSNFFAGAPTANTRRLFRSYTLIGYSTKNLDSKLDGVIARPPAKVPSTNTSINQATEDPTFKIVQCVNTDLLLADICFQNRFPARLPIPYHRGISSYIHESKNEEEENTK